MNPLAVATKGLLPKTPLSIATAGLLGAVIVVTQPTGGSGGGWVAPPKINIIATDEQDIQDILYILAASGILE